MNSEKLVKSDLKVGIYGSEICRTKEQNQLISGDQVADTLKLNVKRSCTNFTYLLTTGPTEELNQAGQIIEKTPSLSEHASAEMRIQRRVSS